MKVTSVPGPGADALKRALEGLEGARGRVGWFETSKYSDGTPVAYIAATHEFGVSFTHPGGTRYVIRDGEAQFVSNSFIGPVHGVTKAHQITIPARPFMRPTIVVQQKAWAKLFEQGAKAILAGNETIESVMEKVGGKAAGDIRTAISKLKAPPLKKGTVDARRRGMADKKTTGNLTKPLVHTGIMLNTLTNNVEK